MEIEPGIRARLHVENLSWSYVPRPDAILRLGDTIEAVVISVLEDERSFRIGRKQMLRDPWIEQIPNEYFEGMRCSGVITNITNFGMFVLLGPEIEGLLHRSQIGSNPNDSQNLPESRVQPDDENRAENSKQRLGKKLFRWRNNLRHSKRGR